MKKSTMILAGLILMPVLSFAQLHLTWEPGSMSPAEAVACNQYREVCPYNGGGTGGDNLPACTQVCVSYVSPLQLLNVVNTHGNSLMQLETNIAIVRQDFQPSISAHATEINNIKSSLSTAELQRMIQKAVREELNQRGL
jgi:hypothetical protein